MVSFVMELILCSFKWLNRSFQRNYNELFFFILNKCDQSIPIKITCFFHLYLTYGIDSFAIYNRFYSDTILINVHVSIFIVLRKYHVLNYTRFFYIFYTFTIVQCKKMQVYIRLFNPSNPFFPDTAIYSAVKKEKDKSIRSY